MIREKTKHLSYSYVTSPVPLFEEQERCVLFGVCYGSGVSSFTNFRA